MTGPRRLALVAAIGLAVAVAAALAAIAAFGARVRGREVAGDVRRGGVVVAFDPAAVRLVDVEVGEARVAYGRDDDGRGGWRRVAPPGPSHGDRVPVLLERLAALRRRTTSAAAHGREEPAAYGLDRPRVLVGLGLAGGTRRVAVGNTTGPDGITFVSAPDGTVAIVSAEAGEAVVQAALDVLNGPGGPAIPAGPGPAR